MSEDESDVYEPSILSEPGHSSDISAAPLSPLSENERIVKSPRKRRQSSSTRPPQKRQRHSQYCPAYNDLFNTTVSEVVDPCEERRSCSTLESGYIGLTYWSADEKETFFSALDRKGQKDVRTISRLIGTKSEPEVRLFLLALRDGHAKECEEAQRNRLADWSVFPAALEVHEECEQGLDAAADGLARIQAIADENAEKSKYGEWWLLDETTAITINPESYSEQWPETRRQLAAALELFDVPMMIRLSTRLFMNSSMSDGNWRSYIDEWQGPGIYATALLDLKNLITEILRRVLASALFLASSRHSSQLVAIGRSFQPSVKARDIQAACELMGLKNDRRSFWIHVAKKCHIDVHEKPVPPGSKDRPLSYDEVEERLTFDRTCSDVDEVLTSGEEHTYHVSDIAIIHEGNHVAYEVEDERAELIDAAASKEEETRLWTVLGVKPETNVSIKQEEDAYTPQIVRKRDIEKDWQDKHQYKSAWQLESGNPSEDVFASRKQKQARHIQYRLRRSTSACRQGLSSTEEEHQRIENEVASDGENESSHQDDVVSNDQGKRSNIL